MTDQQQPEPLRLAERISDVKCITESDARAVAAAADQLCLLHAELETLTLYKNMADEYGLSIFPDIAEMTAELETLRAKLKTYEDLGDAGSDVQILRMGYAAARLEIESLRAAQPAGAPQPGAAYAALPESLILAVDRWFSANTGLGGCSDKDVRELAELFYGVTHAGGRESVDDALAIVESFGPGIDGLNDTYARQILLADEVKRLRAPHGQAPAQAAPAAVADCTRSHPHENMDNACRAKAAIAEMQSMAVRGAEATAQDLERFVSMLAAAPTTQPAPQQEAQEPTLYDPKALLEVFQNAQAGSSSPAGTLRGIAAVIASWESREPHTLIAASQPSPAAQGDALDTERLDFLIEHRAYVVSDETSVYGYWLHYVEPDGATSVQVGEYETPREAIDAARAAQEGKSHDN